MFNVLKVKSLWQLVMIFTIALNVMMPDANAQKQPALSIGDPAPPLVYSKWIKGDPIKSLDGEKIYVLEFWATWCTPCIAAMPHLSDLADQYKNEVSIIGVNVLERTGNQKYDSALPSVTAFVKKDPKRMRYNVIADNNEKQMVTRWLNAAGQTGIPVTFVIKNGVVQWIGHPMFLEKILASIVDGTYDSAPVKLEYDRKMISELSSRGTFQLEMGKIDALIAKKDFNSAIRQTDSAILVMPKAKGSFISKKMAIALTNLPSEQSLQVAKEIVDRDKNYATSIAAMIAEQNGLPKFMYQYGAMLIESGDRNDTFALDNLAILEAKAGDFAKAAAAKKQLIDTLRTSMADPKYKDIITEEMMLEHEIQLKEYLDKAKNSIK